MYSISCTKYLFIANVLEKHYGTAEEMRVWSFSGYISSTEWSEAVANNGWLFNVRRVTEGS